MPNDILTIAPFSLNAGATKDFDIDLSPLYDLNDGTYTIDIVEATTGQTITLNVTINGDAITLTTGAAISLSQSAEANGNISTTTVTINNNDTVTHSGVLEFRTWSNDRTGQMDRDLGLEVSLDGVVFQPLLPNHVFDSERSDINAMLMDYTDVSAAFNGVISDDQNISAETRAFFVPYALSGGGQMQITVRGTASFAVATGSYAVQARLYEGASLTTIPIRNPLNGTTQFTRIQRSPNGQRVVYQDGMVGVNVVFSAPPVGVLEIVGLNGSTELGVGVALTISTKRGQSKKAGLRVKNIGSGTVSTISLVVKEPDGTAAARMITRIQPRPVV